MEKRKWKCPICHKEYEFKGVCFDCEMKAKSYQYYISKNEMLWNLTKENLEEYKETYEKYLKHEEKLEKNRKYKQGNPIRDISELENKTFVWVFRQPKHIAFVESMQYRTLKRLIKDNRIFEALKKEDCE